MNLNQLQARLHELNEMHKAKNPNKPHFLAALKDDLYHLNLTVVLVKERNISNGFDEYMIADNEDEE